MVVDVFMERYSGSGEGPTGFKALNYQFFS